LARAAALLGTDTVVCQVEGSDGHVTTIGSFQLTGGYGYWGSLDPVTNVPLTGAPRQHDGRRPGHRHLPHMTRRLRRLAHAARAWADVS
jgi:hypothetical protein